MAPISPMFAHVGTAAGLQIDARNPQQPDASRAARRLHAHGLDQIGTRIELLVGDPLGLRREPRAISALVSRSIFCGIEQAHVDVEIESGLVRARCCRR